MHANRVGRIPVGLHAKGARVLYLEQISDALQCRSDILIVELDTHDGEVIRRVLRRLPSRMLRTSQHSTPARSGTGTPASVRCHAYSHSCSWHNARPRRKGDTVRHPHHRQVQLLGLVFVLVFSLLAVAPSYRADWLLENWLVFGCAVLLVVSYQRAPMSRGSYIAIALFLSLHEIGAHYTYSEVPYDAWLRSAAGVSINDVTGWDP